MHEQCLGSIAHGGILCLRINRDANCFSGIGELIDVHVADTVGVSEHWNFRALLDGAHHFIRAARDDKTDEVIHLQQFSDFFPSRDKLDGIGNAVPFEHSTNDSSEGRIRVRRFSSAFEARTPIGT